MHVGDLAPGDCVEAALLSDALQESKAKWRGGGAGCYGGLELELVRHAARGHNLVSDMRDAGELDTLLRSLADWPTP